MSLEVAAKHLAAHGRGPDDQLVHMSGKEVAGLQALAKAAGGSLTINPHTGLTEAGFLDNLLPTIVGAGLVYFSGGAIDPITAGAMVGGVETARTGDIGKGALAGLGGFGGAGMVGGLAGAGAAEGVTSLNGLSGEAYRGAVGQGASSFLTDPSMAALGGGKYLAAAAAPTVMNAMQPKLNAEPDKTPQMVRPYSYNYNAQTPSNMIGAEYQPTGQDTSERQYFNPSYTALPPYQAANGGIIALADGGGPVEDMSNRAMMGINTMYPMANVGMPSYIAPNQRMAGGGQVPSYGFGGFLGDSLNDIGSHLGSMFKGGNADFGNIGPMLEGAQAPAGTRYDPETKQYVPINPQQTQMAMGGIANLGSYSDGGRLLRGPGDGVSDSIPAMIGKQQPARLADGEFVVPARIVSELGNGSTEAGAKQLYKMLDRVQKARGKTTGKDKVAKNTNAAKLLPA